MTFSSCIIIFYYYDKICKFIFKNIFFVKLLSIYFKEIILANFECVNFESEGIYLLLEQRKCVYNSGFRLIHNAQVHIPFHGQTIGYISVAALISPWSHLICTS